MVIVEYCEYGCLRNYIWEYKDNFIKQEKHTCRKCGSNYNEDTTSDSVRYLDNILQQQLESYILVIWILIIESFELPIKLKIKIVYAVFFSYTYTLIQKYKQQKLLK